MLRLAAFIGWEISKHLHGEPRSFSHNERKKEERGNVLQGFGGFIHAACCLVQQ